MKGKRMTTTALRKGGASGEYVDEFRRVWPRGVVPNVIVLLRAQAAGLTTVWFADYLLSPEARRTFDVAVAVARKQHEQRWDEIWRRAIQARAISQFRIFGEAKEADSLGWFNVARARAFVVAWEQMHGTT